MGKEVEKEALVPIDEAVKDEVSIIPFYQLFKIGKINMLSLGKNEVTNERKRCDINSSLCQTR
ncbi:hypothetical protein [Bacillus sp. Bos-x628]|uniref:hypothetical protein n=1 Tax=Bacillus maqinnsis TaxID=3229854 RepID=UPI00338DF6BC